MCHRKIYNFFYILHNFTIPRSGDPVVNLDAVTQVARDCLLARMEAIILQVQFSTGDVFL